ncbi:nuclear transport factor 2 family protein [Paenibacillus sp. FSL H7-0331]|uniref:nuclear transport factor 2 family protein n=1 Tax=Paenibacillus sp. FSL H7-0331 TaxID=1920421 RepID=UPI001C4BD9F7|nr:nuclear transport factor 2 family protein [Paenibacillus sp. FSL H7-0331]
MKKGEEKMENVKKLSLEEVADRVAIRDLIDAYAYCADTRDAEGQMALFTEDTLFRVFMNERQTEPSQIVYSRKELAPIFDSLTTYVSTMHFNGQSKIILSGDTAIGATYCFAHHLTIDGDDKKLMVAAIRYNDDFIKINNTWFFKKRDLKVAWIETKPLNS